MTRLPAVPGGRVVAALERAGFRVVRTKASFWYFRVASVSQHSPSEMMTSWGRIARITGSENPLSRP